MANSKQPETPGRSEESRQAAAEVADGLVPMIEATRGAGLDFLAYLLGMALKEARHLASREDR
ncbi:hypothetical protein [Methyloligella solikamskensis]|uniref:Uncharacterized protein n=1 Tax=Methyloligella solikamskensis TaxID=1177756 RepID=A0ABW3J7J2_9HYPH